MAHLSIISLNINYKFPRLATSKPLQSISEKTLTIAVRRVLHKHLPNSQTHVSCRAYLSTTGIWNGQCTINGQRYLYFVQ